MRKVGIILGALLVTAVVLAPALAQQPFADVPQNHWAYNSVDKLAETGVLEGYPDGTFKGKQRLTRYEFAQAIARMLARVEQMKGIPGPQGPAGPAGPAAAGGLTPEQQSMLDRLTKEFAPELAALRSDLGKLTKRVEDLEAVDQPKGPAIKVSGDISLRTGLAGTNLGLDDVDTTGYPFEEGVGYEPMPSAGMVMGETSAYGGINLPTWLGTMWSDDASFAVPSYFGTLPISDALKDSYKPSDFMTMKTRVVFSGSLAENTDVRVAMLAGPETNDSRAYPIAELYSGSPALFTGSGIMDTVAVDEAWLKVRTKFIAPMEMTVGKQYVKRGLGLLVDNNQEATKNIRLDWAPGSRLSWGLVYGMLDREQFYGTADWVGIPGYDPLPVGWTNPTTSGQDNYNLYYLGYCFAGDWKLGLNWLDSGFNQEEGWSASLCGKLYGLDVYGEYANLTKWPTGHDFADYNLDSVQTADEVSIDESDTAWMAGLKWTGSNVALTGEYGIVDAGYAYSPAGGGWSAIPWVMGNSSYFSSNLPLSALHPNAEVDPHDINWIDRPLFLDPTNIAKGWHVNVTFPSALGKDTPLSVSYMDGEAYEPRYLSWLWYGGPTSTIAEPDKWTDADAVWVVKVSKKLSDSVSANLLYGRREVENVMSRQLVPIGTAPDQSLVYAENEPIQVLRAEFCVAF